MNSLLVAGRSSLEKKEKRKEDRSETRKKRKEKGG